MASYIFGRVLWLFPLLLFISLITFALMHSVEGGPWDDPDRPLTPEAIEQLKRQYGFDQPLWRQYSIFLGNAVQGDLGTTMQFQGRPVTDVIVAGLRPTMVLGLLALVLAAGLGLAFGVASATHRNRSIDYAGVLFATAGAAVPSFVLGIFLIYVFGVKLHWLPTFGWDRTNGLVPGWLPRWDQMVLPVITLAALPAAYLARVTRASVLDVLQQDYVRTARAKGIGSSGVLLRHSLPNAAIPILTVIGPITAGLITGSFIVEQLFSVPGIGRLLVQAINARDYNLIMGMTLFYAAVIAVANLVVDVAYAFIDPRVRYR